MTTPVPQLANLSRASHEYDDPVHQGRGLETLMSHNVPTARAASSTEHATAGLRLSHFVTATLWRMMRIFCLSRTCDIISGAGSTIEDTTCG